MPIEAGAGFTTCAGALIRRSEAIAEIVATGAQTKFGSSAELIRAAHVESTEQKTMFRVVRNLVLFNGGTTVPLAKYAVFLAMPPTQIARSYWAMQTAKSPSACTGASRKSCGHCVNAARKIEFYGTTGILWSKHLLGA